MKYYKAEILLSCEGFINNNPDEGCDPDTYNDHGIIETITASTLDTLKDKINKRYDLKLFEKFENRLEYSCEEMGNDRLPYLANYLICLSEGQWTELSIDNLSK